MFFAKDRIYGAVRFELSLLAIATVCTTWLHVCMFYTMRSAMNEEKSDASPVLINLEPFPIYTTKKPPKEIKKVH